MKIFKNTGMEPRNAQRARPTSPTRCSDDRNRMMVNISVSERHFERNRYVLFLRVSHTGCHRRTFYLLSASVQCRQARLDAGVCPSIPGHLQNPASLREGVEIAPRETVTVPVAFEGFTVRGCQSYGVELYFGPEMDLSGAVRFEEMRTYYPSGK